MGCVKLESMMALAAFIECAVPELRDRVCVGQAEAGHELELPSLAIIAPSRWRYSPEQADDVHSPDSARAVFDTGRHLATIQLRLGAATTGERYELEAKVLALFLGGGAVDDVNGELHPGVLRTPVTTLPEYGTWMACWELDDEEWDDEKAFDQEFYSVIVVEGVVPALVIKQGVYPLRELRTSVTDLDTGAEIAASTLTE